MLRITNSVLAIFDKGKFLKKIQALFFSKNTVIIQAEIGENFKLSFKKSRKCNILTTKARKCDIFATTVHKCDILTTTARKRVIMLVDHLIWTSGWFNCKADAEQFYKTCY